MFSFEEDLSGFCMLMSLIDFSMDFWKEIFMGLCVEDYMMFRLFIYYFLMFHLI
jgi:hypothetical protein